MEHARQERIFKYRAMTLHKLERAANPLRFREFALPTRGNGIFTASMVGDRHWIIESQPPTQPRLRAQMLVQDLVVLKISGRAVARQMPFEPRAVENALADQ